METTWTRELLVLDAIASRFEQHGPGVCIEANDLAKRTEMSPGQVSRAVSNLHPTHLEVEVLEHPAGDAFIVSRITDEGRQAVGQWPKAALDRLVQALLDAADQEESEDRRSRLQGAADTIGGFARDVATNAIANAVMLPFSGG